MNIKSTTRYVGESASFTKPATRPTKKQTTSTTQKTPERSAAAVTAAMAQLKRSLSSQSPTSVVAGSDQADFAARAGQPIKEFPEFASVISGNILVNGQSIDINFSTDSLADIIARIDSLDGVEAQVSPRLVINNSDDGSKLDLVDNGTGFLAAVYLAGGSPRPNDFPETASDTRRNKTEMPIPAEVATDPLSPGSLLDIVV